MNDEGHYKNLFKGLGLAYKAIDALSEEDLSQSDTEWVRLFINAKIQDLYRALDYLVIQERRSEKHENVIPADILAKCRESLESARQSLYSDSPDPILLMQEAGRHREELLSLSSFITSRISGKSFETIRDQFPVAEFLSEDNPDIIQALKNYGFNPQR